MMDQISSGSISTNLHASSSNNNANTTSSSASSVIVQQSSGNHPAHQNHLTSSANNSGEIDSLGNILSSTTTSSSAGHNNASTTTTTAGHGSSSSLELTPVQQQRIISTTQQHLTTPTGPGSGPSPILSPPGKVFGRNYNGTMVVTSMPTNDAELQLYRVLQRASLLMYYDTLLEMGGDDVQQLCDAGEEEFLEIMALVGMASKPLHVRRLQKALQEWVTNPSLFQAPLPNNDSNASRALYSPEPSVNSRSPFSSNHPLSSPYSNTVGQSSGSLMASSTTSMASLSSLASNLGSHHMNSNSSLQLTPTLTESQITRLVMSAERLSRQLPQLEPRPQNSKKRSSKDLEQVMAMSDADPRRMDEIRKYAAIYGRFDCKRRPEKPLTLHEVCVNEAAAQICKLVPVLLTRRDELFPLARQVVRDSGFGHSAGIARFAMSSSGQVTRNEDHEMSMGHSGNGGSIAKRTRLATGHMDNQSTPGPGSMHESGKDSMDQREKILSLYQRMGKNFDFAETTKFSFNNTLEGYGRQEYDDNDSRYSFSSSSSPPLQGMMGCSDNGQEMLNLSSSAEMNNHNNSSDMHCDKLEDSKDMLPLSPDSQHTTSLGGVQIIAASGAHIIAVANPALALSPALSEAHVLNVKREVVSPDVS